MSWYLHGAVIPTTMLGWALLMQLFMSLSAPVHNFNIFVTPLKLLDFPTSILAICLLWSVIGSQFSKNIIAMAHDGEQKITVWAQSSPSTLICVVGFMLRYSGLESKWRFPTEHPASPTLHFKWRKRKYIFPSHAIALRKYGTTLHLLPYGEESTRGRWESWPCLSPASALGRVALHHA